MTEQQDYIAIATQSAAVCLQWQASDAGEDGNGYPISEGGDEHTDAVGDLITENVTAFVSDNWRALQDGAVTPEMCGHDLVLTANGHGAGFWDRGLDMPTGDPAALAAYRCGPAFYAAYLAGLPLLDHPKTTGQALTEATRGYSFDAEFRLWGDDADGENHLPDELAWLMVENTVIVAELGWGA